MAPKPSRRWFQLSLRTLFLGVLVVGSCLGWYVSRARRQQELYQAIYRSNSFAYYDYQVVNDEYDPSRRSWAPAWLREQPGADFIHPVVKVDLWEDVQQGRADLKQVDDFCGRLAAFPRLQFVRLESGTDDRLMDIGRLQSLRRLEITHGGSLTERGIAALGGLVNLRHLDLGYTPLSPQGLRVMRELPSLEVLHVCCENPTDEALSNLRRLESLRELRIHCSGAEVTHAGLQCISGLRHLELLELHGCTVCDVGLVHLSKLSNLRELDLHSATRQATNRGVKQLAALARLERLRIVNVSVTEQGLMPLAFLPHLTELNVTGVNLKNREALQQAMPWCKVEVYGSFGSTAY